MKPSSTSCGAWRVPLFVAGAGLAVVGLGVAVWVAASLGMGTTGAPDASSATLAPTSAAPPSPLAQQAQALLRRGQAAQALALLEHDLPATYEQLSAGALLVELSRHLGASDAAVQRGERLVQRWPQRSEAHHALAQALGTHLREGGLGAALFSLGAYKRALTQAVALDPGSVDARNNQIGFLIYAPAMVGGDKAQARRLCHELSQLDPAAGSMMLAMLLEEEGDTAAALALCREAANARPGYQDLGVVYASLCETRGYMDEAIQVATRVVEGPLTAARFRALYQLARLGLERRVSAQTCLDQLDEVAALAPPSDFMPNPARLQSHRGRALERLGRFEQARAAHQRALELDPELDAARAALRRLD
ncbi:MAG: hypothetical protein DRQ55_12925 [Planctomycetota bacterium]|nr:MAG: hypothetical protein DRQ55_12925 [Planctomycetota bacterium]